MIRAKMLNIVLEMVLLPDKRVSAASPATKLSPAFGFTPGLDYTWNWLSDCFQYPKSALIVVSCGTAVANARGLHVGIPL